MFTQNKIIPHLALLLAMLAWASSFIALKVALSAYSPFVVMGGRMLAASIICLPLLKYVFAAFKNKEIRWILLLCVICEPCLYFLFETFALRNTTSGQAGMVIALLPLVVAVIAWLALSERLPLKIWAGFGVAVAGVIWLTAASEAGESTPNPLLGNFLEGVAVLCAAGYAVCAKRLTYHMTPVQLTAAMSFCGAVFFVPLALLPLSIEAVPLEVNIPHWLPIASIIYLGTIVTFAGYGLYNFGIARLTAGRASAYINLIPVLTMIMSVLWLNERLASSQYLASALVILGITLSQGGYSKTKDEQI